MKQSVSFFTIMQLDILQERGMSWSQAEDDDDDDDADDGEDDDGDEDSCDDNDVIMQSLKG